MLRWCLDAACHAKKKSHTVRLSRSTITKLPPLRYPVIICPAEKGIQNAFFFHSPLISFYGMVIKLITQISPKIRLFFCSHKKKSVATPHTTNRATTSAPRFHMESNQFFASLLVWKPINAALSPYFSTLKRDAKRFHHPSTVRCHCPIEKGIPPRFVLSRLWRWVRGAELFECVFLRESVFVL